MGHGPDLTSLEGDPPPPGYATSTPGGTLVWGVGHYLWLW